MVLLPNLSPDAVSGAILGRGAVSIDCECLASLNSAFCEDVGDAVSTEGSVESPQKSTDRVAIWSSHLTPRNLLQGSEIGILKKCIIANSVDSSSIHNS